MKQHDIPDIWSFNGVVRKPDLVNKANAKPASPLRSHAPREILNFDLIS